MFESTLRAITLSLLTCTAGLFASSTNATFSGNSRTFISQRYDIYIHDDKCTMPVDCENITAIIVDKKDNKKLTATGMTITTGVGRNLRGYELSSGKYKFILRQPEAESDKDVNFDQWTLLVEVENERGHFILFFRDTGEITW